MTHRVQTYWTIGADGGFCPAVSAVHGLPFTAVEGDAAPEVGKPVVVTVRADEAALAKLCPRHEVLGPGDPTLLQPPAQPARVRQLLSLACVHRGGPTGEVRQCRACGGGNSTAAMLGCALHGSCLTDRQLPGVQCCRICPDRRAE